MKEKKQDIINNKKKEETDYKKILDPDETPQAIVREYKREVSRKTSKKGEPKTYTVYQYQATMPKDQADWKKNQKIFILTEKRLNEVNNKIEKFYLSYKKSIEKKQEALDLIEKQNNIIKENRLKIENYKDNLDLVNDKLNIIETKYNEHLEELRGYLEEAREDNIKLVNDYDRQTNKYNHLNERLYKEFKKTDQLKDEILNLEKLVSDYEKQAISYNNETKGISFLDRVLNRIPLLQLSKPKDDVRELKRKANDYDDLKKEIEIFSETFDKLDKLINDSKIDTKNLEKSDDTDYLKKVLNEIGYDDPNDKPGKTKKN